MRFIFTIGFYLLSYAAIGQNIVLPTGESITLGDTLKNVQATYGAKKGKKEFYHNKQAGYSFGLDKFNRLEWFSTDKAGATAIIGDGSIKCGMSIQDIRKIIMKQKEKSVRLFGERFLYISGLDNFPNTDLIFFFKNKKLVKKLR